MTYDHSTVAVPPLPSPYSIKRHGVTITNCDSEPVQTPGCIQSHGVLLALRLSDLTILQVSENSRSFLGLSPEELLTKPISLVLGDERTGHLRAFLEREVTDRNPLYLFSLSTSNPGPVGELDVTVHTSSGVVLLEFEPTGRSREPEVDYYGLIKRANARLMGAPTLAAFCQVAAQEVRAATGLDRVMVYRFLPDQSGQVFAESKRDDLHSWMHLRYPAEDVPLPAREIFKQIGVRPLPDARTAPVEMVPLVNPDSGRPLDMTYCALRGASVMYTEYLQNMGVAATLTMPILREGVLWGLIAGHHYTARPFPYQVRAAAELLAQVTSLQMRNAEEREHLDYRARMEAVHHAVLARAAHEGGLAAMTEAAPSLLDGIQCGGVALYHRDKWWTAGRTPTAPQLDKLGEWLLTVPEMHSPAQPVFCTDALASRYPEAAEFADVGSGLIAVPLSRGHRNLMCWFRPEQVQNFDWAGNPHEKPTVLGPNGPRLSPRRSFELWQEQVHGRSEAWNAFEVESALKLRYLVMDLVVSRAEQLASLNLDLTRSNEELDSFAYVASHDLKEPLRGIHKYAYYLMEEAKAGRSLDELARQRLDGLLRLTLRMDGLINALLHFSRVGRLQVEYELHPLASIVQEAIEMLGARLEESGATVRVSDRLPTIRCDRIRVREVFSNLLSNAMKYNDKPQKLIEVGVIAAGESPPNFYHPEAAPAGVGRQTVYYVRDNGLGIDRRHYEQVFKMFKRLHARDAFGGGAGAGLTIVKKLVEQHHGQIWIDSEVGIGTTFYFTLSADNTTGTLL